MSRRKRTMSSEDRRLRNARKHARAAGLAPRLPYNAPKPRRRARGVTVGVV